MSPALAFGRIIPISKLLGNYNNNVIEGETVDIIPISKLLGNYNITADPAMIITIIPISKLLGNYNTLRVFILGVLIISSITILYN